ncbi:MAG: MotA/TolQ/ExbB proton channel family protein [Pirellulaceae bacterium]|nr:MotA/TolQ/ExbB proton channel family protein [Pirellulaceae bacterium]
MEISSVFEIVAYAIYGVLGVIALWGLYSVAMAWMRINEKRFSTEALQTEFLQTIEPKLQNGKYEEVLSLLEDDPRALSQLIFLAVMNRKSGYAATRQLVLDRFQRDILADLEYRLSWVNTVIKSAPMVGLLGTVIGMMGAFGKLAASESVEASQLSEDIMVALITTACGLAIAIPLVLCVTTINGGIGKLEDYVASGLTRFFNIFRESLSR